MEKYKCYDKIVNNMVTGKFKKRSLIAESSRNVALFFYAHLKETTENMRNSDM